MLRKMLQGLGFLSLAMLAGAAIMSPAAAKTTGKCTPAHIDFVASDKASASSSSSLLPVPDMFMSFTQGGNAASCVILQFQAQAHAPNATSSLIGLDARLDGDDTDNYFPPQPQFAANDETFGVIRSMTIVFPSVAPGQHTIRLFFRSANGGVVELSNPSLIVNHN